ncbi:aldehyde:ferredoxin oxidoreductase, partial [Patescibacteria group bacterium]|nr:aldehyde:ferredoxin oxidoreductase [Patescibacteria group bacterium]
MERGYANQILKINLSTKEIFEKPVSEEMKDVFVGGKGFDLKLLWDSVKGADEPGGPTKWNDSENALCIASGPLGGTPVYPGAGKSTVVTISPLTGSVIDSNVGGHFGPFLKFSGFDALEITGKSQKDVIIFIDGIRNEVNIFDADEIIPNTFSGLSHEISDILTRYFGEGRPQDISVVSTGPGAKHALMGCANITLYDQRRKIVKSKQAGRGGTGTVLRNKGVMAIVARWDSVKMDTNNPVDIDALKKVASKYAKEIRDLDPKQNEMSVVGTTHLVEYMNDFDLLPVNNFQFGKHPEARNLYADVFEKMFDKGFDGCWKGCPVACAHGIKNLELKTGPLKGQKVWVDGPEYETIAALGSNLGIFDPHFVAEMNFYCDTYGLDTISVGVSIAFAMEIEVSEDLRFGNKEAVARVLHEMARGEGMGKIIGQGVRKMKEYFGRWCEKKILEDIGMESKGLEFSMYITKESLAQQGGYGFALKGAQHDEAWLIKMDQLDN